MARPRAIVSEVDARRLAKLVEDADEATALLARAERELADALAEVASEGASVRSLADVVGCSPSQIHRLIRRAS